MCKKTNGQAWKPTPKQQLFLDHYTTNATDAARKAGFKHPRQAGTRLLSNVHIAKRVAKAQALRSERTQVTVDKVVTELAKIAFCNADDYFAWGERGVTLKNSEDLTRDIKAAVAEASETTTKEGGTIRIKLHDKLGALEKLGKHLGMFIERTEHSGYIGQFSDAVSSCTPEEKLAIASILRKHQ
jgi:phage terminase small subunit